MKFNARIQSDGYGPGTKVTVAGGDEIQGLTSITWRIDADNLVATIDATLSIIPIEADGILSVHGVHPVTGDLGKIKSILFEDGTEWTAP